MLFAGLALNAVAAPVLSFDQTAQVVRLGSLDSKLSAQVARLDEQVMRRWFRVYLDGAQTAMLGDYRCERDSVEFTPRFPFLPGRLHRAEVDWSALGMASEPLTLRFTPAGLAPQPTARVVSMFPSGSIVPANLLRIYVRFSQPMSRHAVERYVRLLDDTGKPVEVAFLEMEDGLWDPSGTRLTLFLHPGRIKSGLALHDKLGLPFEPGHRYRFVISKEMQDDFGQPLVEEFSKDFSVTGPDHTKPDVSRWNISHPRPGTRDPLIVTAEKPLDEPLFGRLVQVENIAGDAAIENDGTRWRFTPDRPWKPGTYVLHVGGELEDLAGNRPTRLFEETAAANGHRAESKDVTRRFTIP